MSDAQPRFVAIFENVKQLTNRGIEYWSARDLQGALGYDRWENFEAAITRAMSACQSSGIRVDQQFRETTNMAIIGGGGQRTVKDYFLSRYACYLVAMNGDPEKESIAAAQSYFAVQTRRQELADAQDMSTEDEKRLVVRERVRVSNIKLNQAAARAGVKRYAFFHDAGYRGMYNEMSVTAIKKRKKIDEKEELLDNVGRLELAANEFRITLTEERLKDGVRGQAAAEEVHHAVGKKVRQTVRDQIGRGPEDLPPAPSIKKIAQKKTQRLLSKKK